jgi:hypothetical protein
LHCAADDAKAESTIWKPPQFDGHCRRLNRAYHGISVLPPREMRLAVAPTRRGSDFAIADALDRYGGGDQGISL